METSDWLEAGMEMKDAWKYVIEMPGALFATTPGAILMLELYVTN